MRCFDADFILTADGQLLATHPDDLAAALGPKREGWCCLHTLAAAASHGSSSSRAGALCAPVTRPVCHPRPAVAARVAEMSVGELRSAGVDEDRFPTLDSLVKASCWLLAAL